MGEKRPTADEQARRNALIVADRARGLPWRVVSEKHDLSDRRCKEIWTEYRNAERPVLTGRDPLDVVFDLVQHYEAWAEQLAEIAANSKSDSNAIGAIRTQMDCAVRQSELLQATGLMPKRLGQLRVEMDVRYIATQVLAIMDKHKVPIEAQKELADVLSARSRNN